MNIEKLLNEKENISREYVIFCDLWWLIFEIVTRKNCNHCFNLFQ